MHARLKLGMDKPKKLPGESFTLGFEPLPHRGWDPARYLNAGLASNAPMVGGVA